MKPNEENGIEENDFGKGGQVKLDDIVHSMRSGLYVADNKGNISFANRAFAKMFRYESEKDIVGVNLADQLYSQKRERAVFLKNLSEKGYVSDYRIEMVRRDGSRVIIVAQSNLLKDKKGKIVGVEGILKESSESQGIKGSTLQEDREIIAYAEKDHQEFDLWAKDSVTGLFSYQYFIRCLDSEVKRVDRFFQPLCMMMIDIDNFHTLNSKQSKENGDALLQKVGAVLRENFRDTDVVCRQAQDQFLAMLPVTKKDEALSTAKTIKDIIQKTFIKEAVTCSIGMSQYIPGMTSQEFLLKANLGLYMAKEMGKNEACFYG